MHCWAGRCECSKPSFFVPPVRTESDANIDVSVVSALAIGAMASILGRSGSAILKHLVEDGLAHHPSPSIERSSAFSMEFMIAQFSSGRAAKFLATIAEVIGIFVNSQIWSFSINRDHPSKYDGSLCLFLPSLVAMCLCFLSNFLRVKKSIQRSS